MQREQFVDNEWQPQRNVIGFQNAEWFVDADVFFAIDRPISKRNVVVRAQISNETKGKMNQLM
jgi:hypothetical protein